MAKASKGSKKVKAVMHEFKHGQLHSGKGKGGKPGKKVKNRDQAIAIGISEAKKATKGRYGRKRGK